MAHHRQHCRLSSKLKFLTKCQPCRNFPSSVPQSTATPFLARKSHGSQLIRSRSRSSEFDSTQFSSSRLLSKLKGRRRNPLALLSSLTNPTSHCDVTRQRQGWQISLTPTRRTVFCAATRLSAAVSSRSPTAAQGVAQSKNRPALTESSKLYSKQLSVPSCLVLACSVGFYISPPG